MRQNVLLRILDLFKRTNVLPWYKFYCDTIKWDRERIIEYQIRRLKALLKHVRDTVPYYSNIFDNNKININDINSLSVLNDLPIIDRDIIQNNIEQLISKKFSKDQLMKGGSSGTSGIPIEYYHDYSGYSAGVAAGYMLWSMSGWEIGKRNIHIWGNQSSIKQWNTLRSKIKNVLIRQKNIPSTLLNDPSQLKTITNEILKFKPCSFDGYASSIYSLASFIEENNIRLSGVRHVLTTADNLEEYQRDLIERVIGPTGDLYGSGEILGIASRPVNEEKYYILDPHVIVETIDFNDNYMKDIVITDLHNYGMPFIRYKIGDMIDQVQTPKPNSKFPFSWFTKIYGRDSDVINLPNGMKFHPMNVFGGTLFREFDGIKRHKVVWDGNKLLFIFEVDDFNNKEPLNNALKKLLMPYGCEYVIEFTNKIYPSSSGKYKYVEIIKDEKS